MSLEFISTLYRWGNLSFPKVLCAKWKFKRHLLSATAIFSSIMINYPQLVQGCLAIKGVFSFNRREFTKSFNNLKLRGNETLLWTCAFHIYDHPVVGCPSSPSPHCSFTFRLWGGLVRLTVPLGNILSGYETLCYYQNPLEPKANAFALWGLGGNVIEQGCSGSNLHVLLDSTKLIH